jgi:hypothetical protein
MKKNNCMKYVKLRATKTSRIFKPQSDDGFFGSILGRPGAPRERKRER